MISIKYDLIVSVSQKLGELINIASNTSISLQDWCLCTEILVISASLEYLHTPLLCSACMFITLQLKILISSYQHSFQNSQRTPSLSNHDTLTVPTSNLFVANAMFSTVSSTAQQPWRPVLQQKTSSILLFECHWKPGDPFSNSYGIQILITINLMSYEAVALHCYSTAHVKVTVTVTSHDGSTLNPSNLPGAWQTNWGWLIVRYFAGVLHLPLAPKLWSQGAVCSKKSKTWSVLKRIQLKLSS